MARGKEKDKKTIFLTLNFIKEFSTKDLSELKILDFGCGKGARVLKFIELNLDAFGVDINNNFWSEDKLKDVCKLIPSNNYKIPFNDNFFDFVISSSVMEHVSNHEKVFLEIYRVLKPGGYAIHNFPSKYFLPFEPHMNIPFINFFSPMPMWLFYFWSFLGMGKVDWSPSYKYRNSFIELAKNNIEYSKKFLNYKPNSFYEKLSLKVFGNFTWPMNLYIKYADDSNIARLCRKLPFKKFLGFIIRQFRQALLVNFKN